MGWGDVAKETAGAVADSLKKASEIAKKPVDDMKEAVRILTEDKEKHAEAAKKMADAEKEWAAAAEEVAIASQDHAKVLSEMNPKVIEGAKYALEHGVNQKSVVTAYQLTKPEIAAVIDLMEKEKKALQELEEWNRKVAEAMKTHWDGVGAIIDQVFARDKLQAATNWVDAIDAMGGSVNHLHAVELEQLQQAMLDGIDALARSGDLTSQQSSQFTALAIAANVALAALKPVVTVTEDLVKAQWDYVTALDEEARAQKDAADAAKQAGEAKQAAQRPVGGGLLPSAIVGHGGVAYDQYGRPVVAGGAISGLPIVNVNITQPLGTPDAISKAVQDAMMHTYRSGGNRLPA